MTASYNHRQTTIFAFIGMLGGLLCSLADYLLEFLGQESVVLGRYGVTESAWQFLAPWRFPASIWIACFAVPMIALGYLAIARQMRGTNPALGSAFGASSLVGVLGGLFIHILLCVLPIAYQFLLTYASQGIAVATVDAMMDAVFVPFLLYYALMVLVPMVLWCVYAIGRGSLYHRGLALGVVGFSLLCFLLSLLIPQLEWLGVGSVSRMVALWCFVAWRTERGR